MAPLFFAGTKVEQRFRSCKYFSIIFCIPHSEESWNGITRYIRGLPCPDYLPLYLADRISEIYGIILINNEKTIFFRVSAVSESHHTERSRYHPLPISNDFFAVLLQIFTRFFCCYNNVLRLCSHNNVHIII